MSAAGTPKASEAAIAAVQDALGCRRGQFVLRPGAPWGCATHAGNRDYEWTERGCPVAVAAADAAAPHIAAQALRDAASWIGDMGSHRDPCRFPDVECECGAIVARMIASVWLRKRADRIEAGQ